MRSRTRALIGRASSQVTSLVPSEETTGSARSVGRRLPLLLVLVAVAAAVPSFVLGATVFGDGSEGGGSLWPRNLDRLATGVVLIEILDCRGEPLIVDDGLAEHKVTGSGFLVGSRVVMTAEHMVPHPGSEACGMRVRLAGGGSSDVVEAYAWSEHGEDDRRGIDLATLTLAEDATGHIFDFASETERVGTSLAKLGYPLGGPFSISKAVITRKAVQYGKPRVAAKVTPEGEGGGSGGPMLNDRGEVVSVVSGIVVWANLSSDGRHRSGGIDLPVWWGESMRSDLCRAHPDGGIPGCDPNAEGEWGRVPVTLRLSG
jgi:S1-C subfamily serine protease